MIQLNDYPGWKDWVQVRIARTLYFDDAVQDSARLATEKEFVFPRELERQHAVVYQYLHLQQTVETIKECEYYFRRYPFRGLPISRASHLTNICEMYFGRFYEFKERMKKYFEAIKAVSPDHNLDIGKFIRQYERIFDGELRERHGVHHHSRFQDLGIDRVFLVEVTATGRDRIDTFANIVQYRKLAKEWTGRVRRRGEKIDEVLEAVADGTLRTCRFLALNSLVATIAECRGIDQSRHGVKRRRSITR
jgi:hypothetical protein